MIEDRHDDHEQSKVLGIRLNCADENERLMDVGFVSDNDDDHRLGVQEVRVLKGNSPFWRCQFQMK